MKTQKRAIKKTYNFEHVSPNLHVFEFGHGVYPEGYDFGVRVRNAFCMHFIFSGEGTFNGCDVHGGSAFFTVPKQSFFYFASELSKWEHFFILFNGSEAENLIDSFSAKYEDQIFEFDYDENMYKNLYSFIYEDKKHNGYDFLSLLYYLISSEKYRGKKHKEDYVSRAMECIQHNYRYNITVAEIARGLNLSTRYLSRIFKEGTGKTVQEQIIYQKIEHAKSMLNNDDMKICDIAHLLGYENEFAFSTIFKRHTGVSPKQYKTRNK